MLVVELTLIAVAAFHLAPILRLRALFGEVALLIAVAASEIGRILGLSTIGCFMTLLSRQCQQYNVAS